MNALLVVQLSCETFPPSITGSVLMRSLELLHCLPVQQLYHSHSFFGLYSIDQLLCCTHCIFWPRFYRNCCILFSVDMCSNLW